MMISACLLTLSGCGVLAMGMSRHQRLLWGTHLAAPYRVATKYVAYTLFIASLMVCLALPDAHTIDSALSVMTWLGLFPLSALVLICLLAMSPKAIMPLSGGCLFLGGVLALQSFMVI